MKIKKIIIKTKTQKYQILIGPNLIKKLKVLFKKNSISFNKCLLLIDKNIPKKNIQLIKKSLVQKDKKIYFHWIKASETNKNQKNVDSILKILLKNNFSRQDCLVSIGGGITGDIGGFTASIFKRGLKFVNIPTTLLSQVDSSVGGKTGINSQYGKNLIGSFYQPKLVISDTHFLKTLPRREIVCGYGEILKHSLITNKNFFKFLQNNIQNILNLKSPFIEKTIFESCKIKKSIVEKDEKEKNLRKVLNFGHTFGHAYEASLNFSKKLNHGEAVLLGMCSALSFSFDKKLISKFEYDLILNHFRNTNLPFKINKYFTSKNLDKILSFMIKDKKNNSEKINLILLKKIGTPIINNQYNKKYLKLFLKKELNN